MADKKLTDLSVLSSISNDDIIYVVDAPGGTPSSKKVEFSVIKAAIQSVTSNELSATEANLSNRVD